MNCEKHKLKNNFIFCLETDCQDRLACEKCYVLDQKHNGHKVIMVKYFIQNDEEELKRVLDDEYIKNMKDNKTINEFIQQFDNRMNKYLDEREEDMSTSFEKMVN